MEEFEKGIERLGVKTLLRFVGKVEDVGLKFKDGSEVEENEQELVLDVLRMFIAKHV